MEIENTDVLSENEDKLSLELNTYLETVELQIWKIECEIALASNVLIELRKLKNYLCGENIDEEVPSLAELKKIRNFADLLISKNKESSISKIDETSKIRDEVIVTEASSSRITPSYSKILQENYKKITDIADEWQQLSVYEERINPQIYFHTAGRTQVVYIYGNTDV